MADSPSQCHSAKSRKEPGSRCPYRAKPGSLYCGIHKNTQMVWDPKPVVPDIKNSDSDPNPKIILTVPQIIAKNPSRTVYSVILEQNRHDKQVVTMIINGQLKQSDLNHLMSERFKGQWTWTMSSYNIRHPQYLCKHACSYCYIGPMFKRFGRVCQTVPIEEMMPVDPKSVQKSWNRVNDPTQRQMIFFPSSSDIFIENAKDYVQTCLKILRANHEISFMTKPTLGSIQAILHEIEVTGEINLFRTKMVIFITITTDDQSIAQQIEPYASSYKERLAVINELRQHRFRVNVMMEPYFSDPRPMIKDIENLMDSNDPDWIIAIGQLNYGMKMQLHLNPEIDQRLKAHLNQLYSPTNLHQLWDQVQSNPHFFFKKESIKALLKCS